MMRKLILASLVLLGMASGVFAERDAGLFEGLSPDAVYEKLNRARWNLDILTIIACTSERVALDEDQLHFDLMQMRSTLPESLSLQRARIDGRIATLFYLAHREDRDEEHIVVSRGQVTMVQEQGVWRMRHETWEDIRTEPLVREHGVLPRW